VPLQRPNLITAKVVFCTLAKNFNKTQVDMASFWFQVAEVTNYILQ